jgi:hypothetical protein
MLPELVYLPEVNPHIHLDPERQKQLLEHQAKDYL